MAAVSQQGTVYYFLQIKTLSVFTIFPDNLLQNILCRQCHFLGQSFRAFCVGSETFQVKVSEHFLQAVPLSRSNNKISKKLPVCSRNYPSPLDTLERIHTSDMLFQYFAAFPRIHSKISEHFVQAVTLSRSRKSHVTPRYATSTTN